MSKEYSDDEAMRDFFHSSRLWDLPEKGTAIIPSHPFKDPGLWSSAAVNF